MEPKQFALDTPQEFDFDEPGTSGKDYLFVVGINDMISFERANMFVNLDTTKSGEPVLPHRLCKMHHCENLTAIENLLGKHLHGCGF